MTVLSFPTVIHANNDTIAKSCPDTSSCRASLGPGSFCGTDGECHFYNCRDFLAYGQEKITGIPITTSPAPELVCSSYSPTTTAAADMVYTAAADMVFTTTADMVYNGMVYGCKGYSNTIPDPNFAVSMLFNEKCSAQINERATFDCWQFAEGTNFDSFLSEAGNATICTEDDDSPPSFIYITSYGYQSTTYGEIMNSTSELWVGVGVRNTVAFNADFATNTTMYSFVSIEDATSDTPTSTPAPLIDESIPPAYPPTIATSSSASSSARHNWMMASSSLLLSLMKISYSLFFI